MNNLTNLKTDDLIISELNEAIDINSSKKTIAYKYFRGNLDDLEKYLNTCLLYTSPSPRD